MKVIETRHIEDCIDASAIHEIHLDAPITKGLIDRIATMGTLEYHATFAAPFFAVRDKKRFTVKGVQGAYSFRVTLFAAGDTAAMDAIRAVIESSPL